MSDIWRRNGYVDAQDFIMTCIWMLLLGMGIGGFLYGLYRIVIL